MVQINLLPVSAKKKRKRNLELKVKLGPIIFVLGVLVAVIIVIWAMLGIQLAALSISLNMPLSPMDRRNRMSRSASPRMIPGKYRSQPLLWMWS